MSNTEKSTNARDLFNNILLDKLGGKKKKDFLTDVDNIYIEKFPTGSLQLDIELFGGYPKGTAIELLGPTGSSKSTLAIEAVAQHQKKYPNEIVLWLDLEGIFDKIYFENVGVDISPEKFILAQPVKGEEAFEIMRAFCENFEGGIIVVDSVAMLLPSKEAEADFEDAQMGIHARLMSKGLRNVLPIARDKNITQIYINQERTNIGGYGDNAVGTGGKALPYYTRTRIKTGRQNSKGDSGESIGVSYKTIKANFGRENTTVNAKVIFGIGIDYVGELIDLGVQFGVIQKGGSWFSYGESKIGQGVDKVKQTLADNPELFEEVEAKVKEEMEKHIEGLKLKRKQKTDVVNNED